MWYFHRQWEPPEKQKKKTKIIKGVEVSLRCSLRAASISPSIRFAISVHSYAVCVWMRLNGRGEENFGKNNKFSGPQISRQCIIGSHDKSLFIVCYYHFYYFDAVNWIGTFCAPFPPTPRHCHGFRFGSFISDIHPYGFVCAYTYIACAVVG